MSEQTTMVQAHVVCPSCKKSGVIFLPKEGVLDWQMHKMPIQLALPNISTTTRERLLTGYCPACQEDIFRE